MQDNGKVETIEMWSLIQVVARDGTMDAGIGEKVSIGVDKLVRGIHCRELGLSIMDMRVVE